MPAESFPQRFGPYLLMRVLGVGGMGDVFLALSGKPGLERPCVVKRLAQHATSEDRERFRREANLARTLSHGAIAQTLAVDEIDGELIIAQEFLHGCSLSGLLATCLRQRERLPSRLAVHVAREIARALSYAHEQGVTHRDIAPDNVILTYSGEVRLLDFGIARTTADPRLTRPGWSVGREAYAAPEVAAGGGGDPRSDVYSLGVLLWQLLAQRPPPIKEAFLPPSKLNAEVPPDLDRIVLRAVVANPKDRFQRIDEISKALGAHLPGEFSGEREVAAFLQKHYDVARERSLVERDIAQGRAFLQSAAQEAWGSRSGSRRWIPFAVVGACVAAVIVFLAVRAGTSESINPPTVATPVVPPSPPAPSSPPSPPEPVAAPTAKLPPPVPEPPAVSTKAPPRRVRGAELEKRRPPDSEGAGPSDASDLLARAQQRFDMGDIEGALQSARAAIRAGGGAPAHLLAGRALGKQNQLQEAERELAVAVRLDPTNAFAAQRLREVRERIRATIVPPE